MGDLLHSLKQRFLTLDGVVLGGGASLENVQASETVLGVAFPAMLRRYLLMFGHIEIGHHELLGLGADVPGHLNLTRITLEERTEFHPKLPGWLLPIENNGAGDLYCLDLSRGEADPPIVFWSHEEGVEQSPSVVCESFSGWLAVLAEGSD